MPKGVYARAPRHCSIAGCESPHYGRSFCSRHYQRFKDHGDPRAGGRELRHGPLSARVEHYIDPDGLLGCWIWTAYRDRQGYGRVMVGDRPLLAHRVVYELYVGPVPDGLELDHICVHPPCVNPAHLEAVTHAENMRRIAARRAAA